MAVRGTQSLVYHLQKCWNQPSLLALELAWRWLFGIPALYLLYLQGRQIWMSAPLQGTGIYDFSLHDPWQAAIVISSAAAVLLPPILKAALWMVPVLGLGWAVISALGRNLVLRRYEPSLPFRPVALTVLQLLRLIVLIGVFALWFACIQWAAGRTLATPENLNLVGYLAWVIFFSLGLFTVWSFVSWVLTFAPLLVLVEEKGIVSALLSSLRLGKGLTGKLAEVNLVMGIVKLGLIVLAMVFSATPLPFSAQMTGGELHAWWGVVTVLYFAANDFFQVARAVSFLEFWRIYRGPKTADLEQKTA